MKETLTIEFPTSYPDGPPFYKFEEDEIEIKITGNPNNTARVVAEVRGTGGNTLQMTVAMLPDTFCWADTPVFTSSAGLERWGLQSFDKHVQRILLKSSHTLSKLVARLIVSAKEFDIECAEGRVQELQRLFVAAQIHLQQLKEAK